MVARAADSSGAVLVAKRRQDRFQPILDLFRTEPCQCTDDIAGLAVRGRELPARRVSQLHDGRSEVETAVGAGGQVDRADRILRGQPEAVGRRAAAGHDGFAPECGQRGESLAETGRPKSETRLDGTHVNALADAHQLSRAGQTRQCLIDRRAVAEVKQGTRTQRRRLRKSLGMLHDAFGQASHRSVSPTGLSET